MRHTLLCLWIVGCHGARSQTDAAAASVAAPPPSSAAPAGSGAEASDGGSDASAVTLARCFEPSRVTQLGTLESERVAWRHDVVCEGPRCFDPETLAVVPARAAAAASSQPTDLLATGERVEQRGNTLLAGARALPKLAKGERFDRVENGRWIVIASGDDERAFHVIDGLAGTRNARAYVAVLEDLAAWEDPATAGVTVSNLATHATVLKDAALCTAGGTWGWSLSPRFLWCNSNRGGSTGYELRTGKTFFVGQSASMSPDERYVVRVPGVGWGGDLISEDHVEWTSVDTGRTVTLTRDVPRATDQTTPMTSTVPVAFCGDGKLFAIITRKELVVYRGSDAKRLAGAGAMPGGDTAFSRSGRYLLDKRAGAATVYRLDP
jgi:hypothetical protein